MASLRVADLALLVALLAPLASAAQSTGRTIYCCDVNGQPVCGDILPAACYGRAYREISPFGSVRRHVPAPLTAEEIERRDEAIRRRKEAEAAALKQRRLDQALLETYPDAAEIEIRRDRALSELDRTIADLRVRETELLSRKVKLAEEVESHRGQTLPRGLVEDLINVDGEIVAQRSIIDAKLRERESIRLRFDEDRRRYRELTIPAYRSR